MSAFIIYQTAPTVRAPPRTRRPSHSSKQSTAESRTSKSSFFGRKKSQPPTNTTAPPTQTNTPKMSRKSSLADIGSLMQQQPAVARDASNASGHTSLSNFNQSTEKSSRNIMSNSSHRKGSVGGASVAQSWAHTSVDESAYARSNEACAASDTSRRSIPHSAQASTRSTLASVNPSKHATKITVNKKVYNGESLQYVDYRQTLELFERKLYEFHQKTLIVMETLRSPWVYRAANEHFRTRTLDNGVCLQERLLSRENLQMLRFNYFVEYEPNSRFVQYSLDTRRFPYLEHVPAERTYDAIVQEYLQKQSKKPLRPPAPADNRISVEKGLAGIDSQLTHTCTQAKSALKTHLLQVDFWDEVYQDIRTDVQRKQFFDYLPANDVTRKLFMEMLDFFLQRMRMISCEVSDAERENLDLDELHELHRNTFSYLDAVDHAEIDHLKVFLDEQFLEQARVFVACITPELSRDVLKTVAASVCYNLRVQCYGVDDSDEIFLLLEDFLNICIDITLADGHESSATRMSQSASANCSLFDSPIMNKDSPPTRTSSPPLPPLSPICEQVEKKGSFFQRFKNSFKN